MATQAQDFMAMVPGMHKGNQLDAMKFGAMLLLSFSGPSEVTDALLADVEVPGGYDVSVCDFTLYQFQDGSIVWVIDTPTDVHACLHGYYDKQYIQGHYASPKGDVVTGD
jgi:hypothetical protein